jgi:drug/metabolite transporter (DMT)-like permease
VQNNNLKAYIELQLIVFIWGFTAILGALISLDTLPLVWYRMLFAVGFVIIFMVWKKVDFKVSPKILLRLVVLGIIIALHWLTFFKAIKVSNVSVTLACLSTGAFFTAFLEPIFHKRRIILYEILLGLVVIAGLFMIFQSNTIYIEGIILALISAFLSALFSVINGNLAKQMPASTISFYELLSGVFFITIFLLFSGSFDEKFFKITFNDLKYLLILSSICTAYAFIASVKVMKYISPYTVMLTINLEPIYGIILALIIFGEKEHMSQNFYLGALIILSTVLINGYLKMRKNKLISQ